VSKLAEVMAREEGFGIPGAVPTTHHNPGDLLHSPHSFHTVAAPNGVGQIDNDQDGWADFERQLREFADRGMTLQEMIYEYAPAPANNPAGYLAFVCTHMPCHPDDSMDLLLTIPGDYPNE